MELKEYLNTKLFECNKSLQQALTVEQNLEGLLKNVKADALRTEGYVGALEDLLEYLE